ncbi:MAG: FtsQ-type POTRA domain-containing protein [Deltaproteobacteria bacterium]|nr:FtsQ-type POTRA domain-containing protein [Deltaproteobacteria bacterium]
MSLLRLLQRLRNGRSGQRRGTPPAVEAALRAKRARAYLDEKKRDQKKRDRKRDQGGRRAMPSLPLDLFEDGEGAGDALDRLFAVDRSIPAGPLDRPAAPTAATSAVNATSTSTSTSTSASAKRRTPAPMDELPIELPRSGPRAAAPARAAAPRRATPRAVVPPARPLPRFVVSVGTTLALGLGFAAGRLLFEHVWLPRVPLARVAVVGTSVRTPDSIAQALLDNAGAPLDRIDAAHVAALLTADPWIESVESFRLPSGTLLVRVVERRAIARYQTDPEAEPVLLDPTGRPFAGNVGLGGALPLVEGPVDGDQTLSSATLEILEELRRHEDFARDPVALTLHLPGSVAIARGLEPRRRSVGLTDGEDLASDSGWDAAPSFSEGGMLVGESGQGGASAASDAPDGSVEVNDSLAGETGYVLEIGREGPRALLGQSFLKRRIARLAALLAQRDALVAGARVIDLRFADRAVLRTEPTSG